MAQPAPQIIEAFHLAFITVLRTRVDESRYVLKGGANLRYFFSSDRYSEDIDFDVSEADWKFVEQVKKTLESEALLRLLAAAKVSIQEGDLTLQEDTQTTKRWRILLTADGHRNKIRTKIEFSGRNGETRYELATVPDEIVAPYALRPPLVQHYLGEPATEQKVVALAKRPETQARDVFDLDLLLRRHALDPVALSDTIKQQAAEAVVSLTWADFEAQVQPFLQPASAELYDEVTWSTMRDYVAGKLLP